MNYLEKYHPKTCINYISARETRKREIERGLGEVGVQTYKEFGCFNCEGLDESCSAYISLERILSPSKLDRRNERKGRMFRKKIKSEILGERK